jgi:hypothetical protein
LQETSGTILRLEGHRLTDDKNCERTDTMHLPLPNPPQPPEPPALVHNATRDVLWDRPVFKAPPLDLQSFDARIFAEDLKRIGLVQR